MTAQHPPGTAVAVPPGFATIGGAYARRLQDAPTAPACVHFDAQRQMWFELSWSELAGRARQLARALQDAGIRAGDAVALQLPDGPDWIAADWAIQRAGAVTVALFTDEPSASTARLLDDCEARCLITRDLALWSATARHARLPALRAVIPVRGPGLSGDRRVRPLAAPASAAVDWPRPAVAAALASLSSLVYTSGSTGLPKAVMLSQANLVTNAIAVAAALGLRADDRLLTPLPLAHLFGRTACLYATLAGGGCLVFARGAGTLSEDLRVQQPTVLVGVPRLFERLYGGWVQAQSARSAAHRTLLRVAVDAGWQARFGKRGDSRRRWLPAAVARGFGERLRAHLGGHLRLAVSGGAALSPQIGRAFNALGVPLVQGYGLTEAGPVVSVDDASHPDPASCGRPVAGFETRIEPSGELLVRGPGVTTGYWRDPTATRASLDDAGWLRTGDKVSRLDTDRLYLVGRLKELLVTATGEKVSPSDIERRLAALPLVDQVMVVGEARPFLVALVVARAGPLALLRAELGLNDGDDSPAARAAIEEALLLRCQAQLFDAPRNFWILRAVLVDTPWTAGNGLLTPTEKLRRGEILRAHAADLERAYGGHFRVGAADCSYNAALGG